LITEVPGVRVGHWTDPAARTGCTVVLLPAGTVASGEVRGGAPGTREFELLSPERTVDRVNAVVLTGGSAFGLAACDGVVRWCEERGIGLPTTAGPVPIVVGMVIYDLGVGDPAVRPGPEEGYLACQAAEASPARGERAERAEMSAAASARWEAGSASWAGWGPIGAGAGATIGKWRGPGSGRPAGLGSAVVRHGEVVVAALVVANGLGEPRQLGLDPPEPRVAFHPADPLQATTIGVIATNVALGKSGCLLVAQSGHDGLARAIDPAHTGADGDAFVTAATGSVTAPAETVRALGAWVVERAVISAGASFDRAAGSAAG
jgi:L-aminopeptidase/D-esterase-like protein